MAVFLAGVETSLYGYGAMMAKRQEYLPGIQVGSNLYLPSMIAKRSHCAAIARSVYGAAAVKFCEVTFCLIEARSYYSAAVARRAFITLQPIALRIF